MQPCVAHTYLCCGLVCILLLTPPCSNPKRHARVRKRKPQGPEKLFHICVAGLMTGSKGSLFLKQDFFLTGLLIQSCMDKAASQWNTWWQNPTEDSVLKAVPKQASSIQAHLPFVPSTLLVNYCYCFSSELLAYATAKFLPTAALRCIQEPACGTRAGQSYHVFETTNAKGKLSLFFHSNAVVTRQKQPLHRRVSYGLAMLLSPFPY